jgi:spore coat protein A, manganese oxidase
MSISRRQLLKWSAVAGGCVLIPLATRSLFFRSNKNLVRFQSVFRQPPLLKPVYSDATTDYYEMTIAKTKQKLVAGLETEIWGYNGITPGPLIRQQLNRKSVVRFINHLGKDSKKESIDAVIHLHGMGSLPQYDGYAMDAIPPEYYKDYHYDNDKAATLWYHDHVMDLTWRNVYMGELGMYIVEDANEAKLNLPQGEYDIPLILEDKRFAPDGALIFNDSKKEALFDRTLTCVNGIAYPRLEVATRKYRFRLLNGAATRYYKLALSREATSLTEGEVLTVIGNDGGLLAKPVSLTAPDESLRLAMAERYEIVIDFGKYPVGTQLYLQDFKTIEGKISYNPVLRFDVVRQEVDNSVIPAKLRDIVEISPTSAVRTRTFEYAKTNGKWTINGHSWEHHWISARPNPGDVEIWELVSPLVDKRHPVHMHLVDAQILDRNGKPPLEYEKGWKDVFHVGSEETVRVIVQFPQDKQGKYMMHCHDLQHEDNGMMGQFELGNRGLDPVTAAPARSLAQMQKLFSTLISI